MSSDIPKVDNDELYGWLERNYRLVKQIKKDTPQTMYAMNLPGLLEYCRTIIITEETDWQAWDSCSSALRRAMKNWELRII